MPKTATKQFVLRDNYALFEDETGAYKLCSNGMLSFTSDKDEFLAVPT